MSDKETGWSVLLMIATGLEVMVALAVVGALVVGLLGLVGVDVGP